MLSSPRSLGRSRTAWTAALALGGALVLFSQAGAQQPTRFAEASTSTPQPARPTRFAETSARAQMPQDPPPAEAGAETDTKAALQPDSTSKNNPSGGAPASGAKAADKKADEKKDDEKKKVNWAKVPPVSKRAPTGWFSLPSTEPGFYSLLDHIRGEYLEKPPRYPFGSRSLNSIPTYDYDFRYLEDPKNTQHDWSDCYKRIHFGPDGDFLFSTGGEVRDRYMNEISSRGTGTNNFYNNFRVRAYGDFWYKDQFRVFAEFMDADVYGNRLPPNANDGSGPELQNGFVDAKVGDPFGGPLYVRVGRQELLYGSQRLISPPDWANTRRTFQGAKAFWSNEQWSVDAFWVQPVTTDLKKFDSVNNNQNFFGMWGTYRPKAGTFFDLYYLGLVQANTTTNNGDIHTIGSRYAGDVEKHLLFDFEAAVQFGERGTRHALAKMATAGLGWRFAEVPWTPHVWIYYDYASGDKDPTGRTGSNRTFNQLFGQRHNYFGYLDLVARQNIHDLNLQVSATPVGWMGLSAQYHAFSLDSRRDALYAASGAVLRRDATGRAGSDVGDEIDLLADFHLSNHTDLMIGYSKFFGGTFWRRTGNPNNVELFYTQYSFKW
ncbi:alginate export family protein [Gemmata sp. JC717]|uniref:alginate export family protein n=1 Tax=Gemmata algarum TaxID=2975278 RepID=UPI0021BB19F0|nr:alginate export family protein [Gemmata algarum]MDY3556388.1 alginate export family protein [Gemmata algarum]